jgi:Fuc2NAc and GlcNAc transferase
LVPVIVLAALVLSTLLTARMRTIATARALLDIPNSRSSHTIPTPRGGGVSIVVVMLLALPVLAWVQLLPLRLAFALISAGGLVAGIGWLDDRGHVPPRWRLLAHFIAAGVALTVLGGLPPLSVMGETVQLGWVGHALALLYLTWLLNLYNFMDGIDGIAGIHAVTVSLGAVLLYRLTPASGEAWVVLVVFAAAVGGFLVWNFPKARIFMGDSGSGFLGIILGILSLEAAWISSELFWAWVILLGAFVVDATVTLTRRVLVGERVHEAHRSHAYQKAARRLGSHVPVSLAFGGINLLWLLPLACLVVLGRMDGMIAIIVAYLPLACLALWQGAGVPEARQLPDGGRTDMS